MGIEIGGNSFNAAPFLSQANQDRQYALQLLHLQNQNYNNAADSAIAYNNAAAAKQDRMDTLRGADDQNRAALARQQALQALNFATQRQDHSDQQQHYKDQMAAQAQGRQDMLDDREQGRADSLKQRKEINDKNAAAKIEHDKKEAQDKIARATQGAANARQNKASAYKQTIKMKYPGASDDLVNDYVKRLMAKEEAAPTVAPTRTDAVSQMNQPANNDPDDSAQDLTAAPPPSINGMPIQRRAPGIYQDGLPLNQPASMADESGDEGNPGPAGEQGEPGVEATPEAPAATPEAQTYDDGSQMPQAFQDFYKASSPAPTEGMGDMTPDMAPLNADEPPPSEPDTGASQPPVNPTPEDLASGPVGEPGPPGQAGKAGEQADDETPEAKPATPTPKEEPPAKTMEEYMAREDRKTKEQKRADILDKQRLAQASLDEKILHNRTAEAALQDRIEAKQKDKAEKERVLASTTNEAKKAADKAAKSGMSPRTVLEAHQIYARGRLDDAALENPIIQAELTRYAQSEDARREKAKKDNILSTFVPRDPEDIWMKRHPADKHADAKYDTLEAMKSQYPEQAPQPAPITRGPTVPAPGATPVTKQRTPEQKAARIQAYIQQGRSAEEAKSMVEQGR